MIYSLNNLLTQGKRNYIIQLLEILPVQHWARLSLFLFNCSNIFWHPFPSFLEHSPYKCFGTSDSLSLRVALLFRALGFVRNPYLHQMSDFCLLPTIPMMINFGWYSKGTNPRISSIVFISSLVSLMSPRVILQILQQKSFAGFQNSTSLFQPLNPFFFSLLSWSLPV